MAVQVTTIPSTDIKIYEEREADPTIVRSLNLAIPFESLGSETTFSSMKNFLPFMREETPFELPRLGSTYEKATAILPLIGSPSKLEI